MHRKMWRKALFTGARRQFSSGAEIPNLYSFLQPSIFALNRKDPSSSSIIPPSSKSQEQTLKTLTPEQQSKLEKTIQFSLFSNDISEAWKSFKSLTNSSSFPSKSIVNSLITYLSSPNDALNFKRAYATVVYFLEKNPNLLEYETVSTLLRSMETANSGAPAFALVRCMFKNRYFIPFNYWGHVLIEISRKNSNFVAFLHIFNDNCKIALDEKLDSMKPDLSACNAALEGCCHDLESVADSDRVIETMALLGIRPDSSSFGYLGYLYALKGLDHKITELEHLMNGFGFTSNSKGSFHSNLIMGYVKSGNLDAVSLIILREDGFIISTINMKTHCEIVKGYFEKDKIKELGELIIETQKFEQPSTPVEATFGYNVISACISLGFLQKANSVLDEMKNSPKGMIGLGVYIPILKAYCKEQRTAEATQLATEISCLGLQLDGCYYDDLIESSMSCQDFQSAFSLFRDMRESRTITDLKPSYLTIMAGLTESQRPELMAAFLDDVIDDPRIEVGSHDWNSIIHSFCKAGRVEDARRTFRRMLFLRYEPNVQTYLSLINCYCAAEKYFNVMMLWNEVKRIGGDGRFKLEHGLVDAFLYGLVKGGFFDAVMEVVEKSQEMKIFVDKWRYKQAFMENHKKLRVAKLRRRNLRKMEALIAFKNWAGLST
ncbi:pentatricopeptide repeat-containing protein At1g69290 [Impatiens glandulifera]|uniref:pentatricopeptide repeat-containing protein At1g69290 n=1 Tax=Impatiens glandulifera TaxID=253017 RepID=UPI001FB132A2|nr:pentatricopeptide repeat-containing protein At1g69290 [Impatiens glandulifera]